MRKGENDCRNYFMMNLPKGYVAELGFELVTPGCNVRVLPTTLLRILLGRTFQTYTGTVAHRVQLGCVFSIART